MYDSNKPLCAMRAMKLCQGKSGTHDDFHGRACCTAPLCPWVLPARFFAGRWYHEQPEFQIDTGGNIERGAR